MENSIKWINAKSKDKSKGSYKTMGVKVCFYPDIINEKCMYSVKAGEICSEFIARYFFKSGNAPEYLLNSIIKEQKLESDEKNIKQEISKNIYKVKIDDMFCDSIENFEIKTFKDSKIVREKLLDKYKEKTKGTKVDIYALLTLDN